MSFTLTKILPQFIYPISFCIGLCIVAGLLSLRYKTAGVSLFLLSITLLWACSTPALSSYLRRSLEWRHLPLPVSDSPTADAVVIIGGAVGRSKSPDSDANLTYASDRIRHAARLFQRKKAPFIIVSAGSIGSVGKENSTGTEAHIISMLLQEWGVPETAIVLETGSWNTHQNAANTKPLLFEKQVNTILLVTSAIHMPRALATFRRIGINTIPSPTDFNENRLGEYNPFLWIPDAGALNGTTQAIKEYLGLLVYRLRGWI